jgi:DNA invertase Pin-like site-specific DNA recombinase
MTAAEVLQLSTAKRPDSGVSLEAQTEHIAAWCRSNGHRLTAAFADEGASREKVSSLPGLQTALKEVCRRKSGYVAYSLSRLTRTTRDTLGIAQCAQRAGADLAFMSERTDTAGTTGKKVFRVLALLRQGRDRRGVIAACKRAFRMPSGFGGMKKPAHLKTGLAITPTR